MSEEPTFSDNLLRAADIGHMLELRRKTDTVESELNRINDGLRDEIKKLNHSTYPAEGEKSSFLIVWKDLGQWEFVKDYEYNGPHDYAFNSKNYKRSRYFFILMDDEPETFVQTPEDDLLEIPAHLRRAQS